MKKIILLLSIFSIFILLAGSAHAAEQGLSISPPVIKIRADHGSEVNVPIKVENLTKESLEAEIMIRPIYFKKDGSPSLVLYKDYTAEMASFLKIISLEEGNQNISKIIFTPQSSRSLSLKIILPEKTKSQEFYFAVTLVTNPKNSLENSHSNIRIAVSSLALLSINKGTRMPSITSFSSPLLLGEGKIEFDPRISNNGSQFVTVKPKIIIQDVFGKVIETIELEKRTLPAYTTLSLTDQTRIETGSDYFFGPYKATLDLASEENELKASKSYNFVIVPGKSVIITFLIAFTLLYLILKIKAKRKI